MTDGKIGRNGGRKSAAGAVSLDMRHPCHTVFVKVFAIEEHINRLLPVVEMSSFHEERHSKFLRQKSRRGAQFVEGANGVSQQDLGFRKIGSDNRSLREKPGYERRDRVVLEQSRTTAGNHHRIDNNFAELAAGKIARDSGNDRRIV